MVVVAPPAHRIARSTRTHSIRVLEMIAHRAWEVTPRKCSPKAMSRTRSWAWAQVRLSQVSNSPEGAGTGKRKATLSAEEVTRETNMSGREIWGEEVLPMSQNYPAVGTRTTERT